MTREQITRAYEEAGRSLKETQQDPRHRMLIDAADAYERYQRSLRALCDLTATLHRHDAEQGIGSIWDTVLEHSCIDDLKRAAHKVEAIRSLLHWLPLPDEKPIADLIRAFAEHKAIGEEA